MTTWSACSAALAGFLLCAPLALAVDSGEIEGVSVTDAATHVNNLQFNYITSYRAMEGKFDPYGYYSAYPDGSTAWSWMNVFSASYRLSQHFEVGGSFSVSDMRLSVPTGSMSATSLGHPLLNGRYHTPVLNGWAHAIAHLGLSMPYGIRNMQQTGNPSAALPSSDDDLSAGGLSGWGLRAGVGISKSLKGLPLRVALDLAGSYPFPSTSGMNDAPAGTDPVTVLRGKTVSLSEGLSYILGPRWTVNGGLQQSWTGDTYADSEDVTGTAGRSFSSSLGASYIPSTAWRLNAGFSTPWPFYSYCVNTSYSPAISLGMSYTGLPI